jgi:hypothetical protein
MNPINSIIAAGAVALAFGALQAKAQLPWGGTALPFSLASGYQFEPINFNLTAKVQALSNTNSGGDASIYIYTFKTEKITTQSILKAAAVACGTNWPTGAKLALDLQSGDVFVVDKTGTNPLFDLTQGINTDTNEVYVSLSFNVDDLVIGGKQGPVLGKLTTIEPISWEINCYLAGVENVYLSFSGNDTSVFSTTGTSATQTDDAAVLGSGQIGDSDASISGEITGSGSWKPAPPPQESGGFGGTIYNGGVTMSTL